MKDKNNEDIEDFHDNEDELNIYDIIQNSTEKKRSTEHPFTARSLKSDVVKSNKIQSILGKGSHFFEEKIKDKWVGLKEKRRHKKGKGFSKRALSEFLDYYKDLYQEKSPDINKLYKLLIRNGTPDMSNPYSEGNLSFYSYHPMGFIVADLEVLLSGMVDSIEDSDNELEHIQNNVFHRDEKKWLSVSEFLEDEEKDKKIKKEHDQHLALQSWALILALGDSIDNLKKEVHIDNIEIATIETILIVKIEDLPHGISIEKIINGAMKFGILNEHFADSLMRQRKEADSGKTQNKNEYATLESEGIKKDLKEQIIIDDIPIKPLHMVSFEKKNKNN